MCEGERKKRERRGVGGGGGEVMGTGERGGCGGI